MCFNENKFVCVDNSLKEISVLKVALKRYNDSASRYSDSASDIILVYLTVRGSHKFNGIAEVKTCTYSEIEFEWMCKDEYTPIKWDSTGNLKVQHLSKDGGKELFCNYAKDLQQKMTISDSPKFSSQLSMTLSSSNQVRQLNNMTW